MYVVDVLPKEEVKEPHAWFKVVQVIPPAAPSVPSRSRCARRTGRLTPDYLLTQAFNGLVNGAYFALWRWA